ARRVRRRRVARRLQPACATLVRAPRLRAVAGFGQRLDGVGVHFGGLVACQHFEFVAYRDVVAVHRAHMVHHRHGDLAELATTGNVTVPGGAYVLRGRIHGDAPAAGTQQHGD